MGTDHSATDVGTVFDLKRHIGEILEIMIDGLIIVNWQRQIIYANQSMKTISGYSPGELIGSSCSIFQFSNCPAVAYESLDTSCELFRDQNMNMKRMRCTIRHKQGQQVHVLKNAAVLRNKSRELVAVVESITDITSIVKQERELNGLRNKIYRPEGFMGMLGVSPAINSVFEMVKSAAITDAPVIIHGESGTGKELVSTMMHRVSKRRKGPLVKVNCAALSESLLESELFGHVKGAFTGASRTRKGRFETAHGGSIFLDEIGDVPSSIQLKLLRVLDTKEFERVGDSRPMKTDVRFISATHRNLKELMNSGKIREDFYYRLNVIPIRLPPLRERGDDLNILVNHFIQKIAKAGGITVPRINSATMVTLKSYSWPGNVRELISALEYAFVTSRGRTISPEHLPMSILTNSKTRPRRRLKPHQVLGQKEHILRTLKSTGGNKAAAARVLGVSRVTLWKWLKNI